MGFQMPITIAEAIGHIQTNRYVLPAIQREFVWRASQIERLFDSLMRGYPIGSFLFWEIQPENLGEYQFYRFMDAYHQRDRRHNDPIALTGPQTVFAILDGQQRLTALNIGLKGWYASKMPYYSWESDWAFPRRRLCLNLLSTSATEDEEGGDLDYEFRLLREKDAEKRDDTQFWFPVSDVLGFRDTSDVFDYCFERELTRESREPFRTLSRLRDVVCEDNCIHFFQETDQDLDKVLNIFIRVNSGGTILSYSDMLLSIATAQWQTRDAREEIHGLVDGLNDIGEGFDFNKDFVLKACLVLTDIGSVAFKVDNFNRANMLRIEEKWDAIASALRATVRLLASWGYSRQTMVSNNAAIPMAYYLHQIGSPSGMAESEHFEADRQRMRRWLAIALLRRTFSGNSDNVLRTIRSVLASNDGNGFPEQAIHSALAGTAKSMAFDEAGIEGLLSYRYGQPYTFSTLALIYRWLKYDQHFHIDHIFPRSWFNKSRLNAAGVPEELHEEFGERADSLANLQLLQGLPNIEKSDRAPAVWMAQAYPSAAEEQHYRTMHLIPAGPLDFAHFLDFIEERETLLQERLVAAVG